MVIIEKKFCRYFFQTLLVECNAIFRGSFREFNRADFTLSTPFRWQAFTELTRQYFYTEHTDNKIAPDFLGFVF